MNVLNVFSTTINHLKPTNFEFENFDWKGRTSKISIKIIFFSIQKNFWWIKKLMSLNVSQTNHGEPRTRPPICTTYRQPTLCIISFRGLVKLCDSEFRFHQVVPPRWGLASSVLFIIVPMSYKTKNTWLNCYETENRDCYETVNEIGTATRP